MQKERPPLVFRFNASFVRRYHLASFPHVMIGNDALQATVFLPHAQKGYYRSSRFDWGSMVGHFILRIPNSPKNVTLCTSIRPLPHRPLATEDAIGIASEFGCGVRGELCHQPGLKLASNGVLGYGDAGAAGTFLKVGVGKLRRPLKLRTDGFAYNFTWPYEFAELPGWEVDVLPERRGILLTQEVRHKRWGWRIRRKIHVCSEGRPILCVDMTVTNLGDAGLTIPYASGNAFNMMRGPATGPGFGLGFADFGEYYDHASSKSPLTLPLTELADVIRPPRAGGQTRVSVKRRLLEHEAASINFNVANATPPWDGKFRVQLPAAPGWNLIVRHTLWRDSVAKRSGWFGFNVRISRRAVSPRPYLLLDLEPEESASITHR